MKNLFYLLAALLLVACVEENNTTESTVNDEITREVVELRNKIAQIELENQIKDSLFNESIAFFNEIQDNLAKINVKQEEIRIKSSNPEISSDDKEWILQQINNINYLREENARKVKDLQGALKEKSLKITELEAMIERLQLRIKSRDEEIESLQIMLADRDVEYAELFDQYQTQVELALDVLNELNTVHYAFGTLDELVENNVLVREGGFIGIGRKTAISESFNKDYFKHLDKRKTKEITIVGNKPQIITDHPASSYEWKGNKLIIKDANSFWRISNYLVVTVK